MAAEAAPFRADRFIKLALDINWKMVGRPYSLINAPGKMPLEFYFILFILMTDAGGALTPRLAALDVGDVVWVSPCAAGFLTLSEVPEAKHLWLLSTGIRIGPFLSIPSKPKSRGRCGRLWTNRFTAPPV